MMEDLLCDESQKSNNSMKKQNNDCTQCKTVEEEKEEKLIKKLRRNCERKSNHGRPLKWLKCLVSLKCMEHGYLSQEIGHVPTWPDFLFNVKRYGKVESLVSGETVVRSAKMLSVKYRLTQEELKNYAISKQTRKKKIRHKVKRKVMEVNTKQTDNMGDAGKAPKVQMIPVKDEINAIMPSQDIGRKRQLSAESTKMTSKGAKSLKESNTHTDDINGARNNTELGKCTRNLAYNKSYQDFEHPGESSSTNEDLGISSTTSVGSECLEELSTTSTDLAYSETFSVGECLDMDQDQVKSSHDLDEGGLMFLLGFFELSYQDDLSPKEAICNKLATMDFEERSRLRTFQTACAPNPFEYGSEIAARKVLGYLLNSLDSNISSNHQPSIKQPSVRDTEHLFESSQHPPKRFKQSTQGHTNTRDYYQDLLEFSKVSPERTTIYEMVNDSIDKGEPGHDSKHTSEEEVKLRIINEYEKLKIRKADRRNAEIKETFNVNKKGQTTSYDNVLSLMEEYQNDDSIKTDVNIKYEQNYLKDVEKEDLVQKHLDRLKLSPPSVTHEDLPDEGYKSKESSEVGSEVGDISYRSALLEKDHVPDKQISPLVLKQKSAPPNEGNNMSPVVETEVESEDSHFATPATPKKYKKVPKVLYLKESDCQTNKFELLTKFDSKKYLTLTKSFMPQKEYKFPKLNSWIPVTANKLFDPDAVLSNIPYLGDEEVDKGLIAKIEEDYNKRYVEQKLAKENQEKQKDREANFLEVFNVLLKFNICKEEPSSLEYSPRSIFRKPETKIEKEFVEKNKKGLDLLYYFRAHQEVFPSDGSTDILIKNYERLTNPPTLETFFPNIDGANEVGPASVLEEEHEIEPDAIEVRQVLNTYQSMHCRRCFVYDCSPHEDNNRPGQTTPYFLTDDQKCPIKMESEPCGKQCFLHVIDLNESISLNNSMSQGTPGLMSPMSPGIPNKLLKYDAADNPTSALDEEWEEQEDYQWSRIEELLCLNLLKCFPHGYCAVARVMVTKTCRQVYEKFKDENLETKKKRRKKRKSVNGAKRKPKSTKGKQANKLRAFKTFTANMETVANRHNYSPCYHPGELCSEKTEGCNCINAENFCDKFCYCSKDCKNRFPGCQCRSNCNTKHCPCYIAGRECDPDLCGKCNASDFDYVPHPETSKCKNIAMQRKCGKKLLISKSDIENAGWGCFIGESAKKDEFIAEYVGEIITLEESERRGEIYDFKKSTYMFTLNNEYLVDACRFGGKIRFANHSDTPNCNVHIKRVLGDYKVGLYAAKDIKEGEELFFKYGEKFLGHDLV